MTLLVSYEGVLLDYGVHLHVGTPAGLHFVTSSVHIFMDRISGQKHSQGPSVVLFGNQRI